MESFNYDIKDFKGRNRRLLHEWQRIEASFSKDNDVEILVEQRNSTGLPVAYRVIFNIHSLCGVKNISELDNPEIENPPLFDNYFEMSVIIPENFPDVDSQPIFRFEPVSSFGKDISTPWHPNIRYFGPMKGIVCLNRTDTFIDIAQCIRRVSEYLRYSLFHADLTPPFPEDLKVAKWVREQAEPEGWIYF